MTGRSRQAASWTAQLAAAKTSDTSETAAETARDLIGRLLAAHHVDAQLTARAKIAVDSLVRSARPGTGTVRLYLDLYVDPAGGHVVLHVHTTGDAPVQPGMDDERYVCVTAHARSVAVGPVRQCSADDREGSGVCRRVHLIGEPHAGL